MIKPSACDDPRYFRHTGPALVFDDYPSMKAAVEDESLDVTADHILILRNAGPQGGPGMPEWGMLPIPKKLSASRACATCCACPTRASAAPARRLHPRMSPGGGTSGGPFALVRTGDLISVDIDRRSIHL